MTPYMKSLMIFAIFSVILCMALTTTGCTNTQQPSSSGGTFVTTTVIPTTATPTQPAKTLIVFTAASLKGASDAIAPEYANTTAGTTVKFNLDGTQVLKQQLENGARADVLISASSAYTNALKNEGFLVNDTVKPLTSNYIIVIIPSGNPGHIATLADLGTPGKKIAMGTAEVPVGANTRQCIAKLTNDTFNATWNSTLFQNVVSYETQEPGVVTKVALGEVDAGFVYESSFKSAQPGILDAIVIPSRDNSLQTYTIGVTNTTTDKDAALKFETFLLSPQGQKILTGFGFRPAGP